MLSFLQFPEYAILFQASIPLNTVTFLSDDRLMPLTSSPVEFIILFEFPNPI